MLENKKFLGGDRFRNVAAAAGLTVAFTVASLPSMASDATGTFAACTSNGVASVAIAEAQMGVDVSNIGGGQVRFDLTNTGADASSITDVYFDDNNSRLTSIALVDADDGVGGDSGVDFSIGAAPPDLPSGNTCSPSFSVSAGLLADADSPMVTVKGVNPGEELGVIFDLASGTFADVLDDLESGALRVGIHVQAFANGESESLVSEFTRNMEVAEPGTIALFGFGIVGLAYARRRRSATLMEGWLEDKARPRRKRS